eukprot:jgi/Pico_ML_1/55576/g1243.t1
MARRTSAPRLSYALRASDRREEAHCAGVNALLLDEGKGRLFSAARDACVRQWDVAADVPNCVTKYEAHAGWVHALAMVQEDVLVSASSDQCVRFWNARTKDDGRDGRCRLEANPSCGCEHEDYVVALAAATCAPRVVSGGLDAQAVLWDVTKARACAKLAPGRGEAEARSIYALACDASATLVLVGCTGGALRMWDTRTNGMTKLTAPRILHVAKIKNYVVQKLLDSGVDLRAEAGIREGQSSSMAESLVVSDGLVDIIGNGKVLEPDMSLATICKYTCKRTNDIELFYCRRAENNGGVP